LAGIEFLAREAAAKVPGTDPNKIPMVGAIECFCTLEEKRIGMAQYFLNKDYKDPYKFTNQDGGEEKQPLCETFYGRKKWADVLSRGVGYAIVGLNTVIRMVVIKSITWVGCDDSST
jgi:hypothetical protein